MRMPNVFPLFTAVILVLIAAGVSNSPARADPLFETMEQSEPCRLSLNPTSQLHWRGPLSRGYATSDTQAHAEQARLEVRNSGGPCEFEIRIEPLANTNELSGDGDVLTFLMREDLGAPQIAPGLPLILTGRFPGDGGIVAFGFFVELPPGQSARAGLYRNELNVTIRSGSTGMTLVEDSKFISVVAEVWPKVVASIGHNAALGTRSATIDLGRLRSSTVADLDFSVDANTAYEVAIKSGNSGALKHQYGDTSLAYNLIIDGRLIAPTDLGAGSIVMRGDGSGTHAMRLEMQPFNERAPPAGRYSDQLTVTITAP